MPRPIPGVSFLRRPRDITRQREDYFHPFRHRLNNPALKLALHMYAKEPMRSVRGAPGTRTECGKEDSRTKPALLELGQQRKTVFTFTLAHH